MTDEQIDEMVMKLSESHQKECSYYPSWLTTHARAIVRDYIKPQEISERVKLLAMIAATLSSFDGKLSGIVDRAEQILAECEKRQK